MNFPTIETLWQSYRQKCVAQDADAVQLAEMRRAFLGGFCAMWEINSALSEPTVTESRGIKILEFYHQQLVSLLLSALLEAV